eukprot:6490137-Amphidinium_carterae.1
MRGWGKGLGGAIDTKQRFSRAKVYRLECRLVLHLVQLAVTEHLAGDPSHPCLPVTGLYGRCVVTFSPCFSSVSKTKRRASFTLNPAT